MTMTTVPPGVPDVVEDPLREQGVAFAEAERGPAVLIGRTKELSQLESLFAEARPGGSRVLVLRGEPGIGKTDLLEYAISSAPGWRVVRTVGVESEAELAFAALQQLCSSSVDLLERLPGPQQDALSVAFGLTVGTGAERFLVGLATLSLFSKMADDQPTTLATNSRPKNSRWPSSPLKGAPMARSRRNFISVPTPSRTTYARFMPSSGSDRAPSW